MPNQHKQKVLALCLSLGCAGISGAYAQDKIDNAIAPPDLWAPSTSERAADILAPPSSDLPNRPVNRFALSLSKAFTEANAANPDVVTALKELDIAQAQLKTASAMPNPQLAIQMGAGTPYTHVITGNTHQVGINQLVETNGKRQARIKLAKANLDLAKFNLEDLRFDVRAKVRRAYAELAAAEANIDLLDKQTELVGRLYQIAQKRFKDNKAYDAEIAQARFAIDQFETQRILANARLRKASVKLDYLLGFSPMRDIDVDNNRLFQLVNEENELIAHPADPLPKLTDLIAKAYQHRPDLRFANQQNVVNSRAHELEKRQRVPDVLLGSGVVFTTYNRDQRASQQQGAYFNVNMDLPVFYRHEGEIAQAKATLEKSTYKLSATEAEVESEVHIAYADLVATRANIFKFQNELIPKARSVVELAHKGYERGTSDISDVILAQQSFQTTLTRYFDTVTEYQKAWADLETAVGETFTLSLGK